MVRQYPEAIDIATTQGHYPIHVAILSTMRRDNPATAVDIVRFLLDCDPNQKLKRLQEDDDEESEEDDFGFDNDSESLLRFVCMQKYKNSNIEAGVQIIKILFDAHPEAIEGYGFSRKYIRFYHQQVQEFINNQLVYARLTKDHLLMTTRDDNGQLPLHTALLNNVRLGSIKLLVTGNPFPSALQSADNNGRLPLHVACQHHDSTDVIDFLVEHDPSTLDAVDGEGNTVLHLACQNAKYDTIAMLLKKYDAVSVSKRNAQNKLPINLLWESTAVGDRESREYTESVFQLLKAYPETVMI